jgi:hypothetical protein
MAGFTICLAYARARVKYWEIIADNLSKATLELGLRLSVGI